MDNPPAPTEASSTSEETELTGPDSQAQSVPAECSKETGMSDATAPHESVSSESKMVKQFLWVEIPKRQQEDDDSDLDKPATKMLKTMLTLATLEADNVLSISTPLTYAKAVGDSVWGEMWKEAVKAELTALAANGTWEEVVLPKDTNIVTSK